MGILFSSRSGSLCVNGRRVIKPHTEGLFPEKQFHKGNLSIPATESNILTISQCFLDLYINPIGMLQEKRSKGKKWLHSTVEITKELNKDNKTTEKGTREKEGQILSSNSTRGWHLFSVYTLHRFFWKDFDCIRGSKKHEETDDYHWWLENDNGDIIDLTEEQYRASRIHSLRDQGKKLKPMGQNHSATSKTMAHRITEVLSDHQYNADAIDQYANAYMRR